MCLKLTCCSNPEKNGQSSFTKLFNIPMSIVVPRVPTVAPLFVRDAATWKSIARPTIALNSPDPGILYSSRDVLVKYVFDELDSSRA